MKIEVEKVEKKAEELRKVLKEAKAITETIERLKKELDSYIRDIEIMAILTKNVGKKTDLQKFVELYTELGIELDISKEEDGFEIQMGAEDIGFEGYAGFFSLVEFDKEGNFLKQGFYE